MSVALPYWGLSNPMPSPRVIAIIVILVLSPVPVHVLNDVVDLVTRLVVLAGLSTATVYRHCHSRFSVPLPCPIGRELTGNHGV